MLEVDQSMVGNMSSGELEGQGWQLQDVCMGKLRESIENLPIELLEMAEEDLIAKAKPSDIHWELRHNFWRVFGEMMNNPDIQTKRLSSTAVYTGVCCKKVWQNILKNPSRLAFIVRPLKDFDTQLDTLFAIAVRRMMEIVRLPLTPDKNFDPNKADAVTKMIRMISDRKLGQSIQRSMAVNVNKKLVDDTNVDPDKLHTELEALSVGKDGAG